MSTESAEIVDQGTEIGVMAANDGTSEVVVFYGEVGLSAIRNKRRTERCDADVAGAKGAAHGIRPAVYNGRFSAPENAGLPLDSVPLCQRQPFVF